MADGKLLESGHNCNREYEAQILRECRDLLFPLSEAAHCYELSAASVKILEVIIERLRDAKTKASERLENDLADDFDYLMLGVVGEAVNMLKVICNAIEQGDNGGGGYWRGVSGLIFRVAEEIQQLYYECELVQFKGPGHPDYQYKVHGKLPALRWVSFTEGDAGFILDNDANHLTLRLDMACEEAESSHRVQGLTGV